MQGIGDGKASARVNPREVEVEAIPDSYRRVEVMRTSPRVEEGRFENGSYFG
jgi:hypothetical protein